MAKTPYRVAFGLGVIKNFADDAAFESAMGFSPKVGDFYYNNTSNIYRYYTVDGWQTLSQRPNRIIVQYFDDTLTSTPTGHQTIDGSLTVDGDLVVLSAHTTNKGIYAPNAGLWTLVGLLTNTDGTVINGDSVWIQSGTVYDKTNWVFDGSNWTNNELTAGSVTNSTMHWDGFAWIENATILTSNNSIYGPDDNAVDAVKAASLNIDAPAKAAGTGDGGDIILNAGTSVGGLKGDVKINGLKIRLDAQSASDPASGTTTDVYYNTADGRFKYYDGAVWKDFGVLVAGADKQIQFNNGGSDLGASSDFTWDDVTKELYVNGKLTVTGPIDPTYIEYTQIITPSNPAAGKNRAYFKADGKLYRLDSAGSEVEIGSGTIGAAEDSDYTDGLFTDFTPSTPIGTAVDRFNEILKALAPQPAPVLSSMGFTTGAGPSAKLSWGTSNAVPSYSNVTIAGGGGAVDINNSFTASGNRKGAYAAATTSWTGTLANTTTAGSGSPNPAYPANSFGSGNLGFLRLLVNGVQVHQVDLTSFGSGSSVNGNGSGFNLSAATNVLFPDGTPLTLFKYRTGTWTVNAADCQLGHNYFQVEHYIVSANVTQKYDLVRDTDANAISASSGVLNSLSMSGLKQVSGVKYHTSGTASYGVTVNNSYRNLYSTSQITYTVSNCSVPAANIPNMVDETDTIVLSGQVVTVTNSGRLLNASISVGVNVPHPLKTALSNGQNQSISGILLDNVSNNSTDVIEYFDAENIRMASIDLGSTNNYAAQADVTNGSNVWDGTQNIISGGSGHQSGLLYENSAVKYPTQGTNSGNYSTITNGPAANVNYSGATGNRHFYIKFKNNSGSTKSNFKINIAGSSASFTDVVSGPSSNNLTVEMKFPTGALSTATGWMDCYSDFLTAQWADGNGARLSANGAGRALATDWGLTIGTKSIATNEYIVMRVTASSSWTGNLSQITLTWL